MFKICDNLSQKLPKNLIGKLPDSKIIEAEILKELGAERLSKDKSKMRKAKSKRL
jgi:hypothetical protein